MKKKLHQMYTQTFEFVYILGPFIFIRIEMTPADDTLVFFEMLTQQCFTSTSLHLYAYKIKICYSIP